ncbi:Sm protein [Trichomonas vaginalis G3]|uniref:Sm protein F n=1 Tax=Trichomonas vaginalis (strain ATCC PRA-98 / G3) TaxID=412133 RepID=A2EH12_TRIV3|nr:spliceosomal snRNP assembly [Trichomonas vaginalis G3]EAY08060.1 Sm protein [Trichomonas vaginalis G3]KAI5543023.1 spliceosomal snRNP assembly [Trichomonas vaginalis G3]|eukprot:XP_001320283.1 Sm protein [Trichomonas vaginalis G3]
MSETTKYFPQKFMESLLNKQIVIKLKWENIEYVGTLISFDERMNIHLSETSEYVGGKTEGVMGDVIIRCNNILHIREKPEVYPPPVQAPQLEFDEEAQ